MTLFCSAETFATSLHQGRDLFAHFLFHFFAAMTFLAGHAGGPPYRGVPTAPGSFLKYRSQEVGCTKVGDNDFFADAESQAVGDEEPMIFDS